MKDKKTEINLVYAKVPPQSIELEKAVLGALLTEKQAISYVHDFLIAEMFYKESHQKIYEAICDLHKEKEPIDILTVTDKLKSKNELDNVGGSYYVTTLSNSVVTSANIEYHTKIIQGKYQQREIINVANEAANAAYNEQEDSIDILNNGLKKIDSILISSDNCLSLKEIIHKHADLMDKRNEQFNETGYSGIPIKLHDVDKITQTFMNKKMYLLAARPAMGKTAVALKIAKSAAEQGKNVIIASLEMEDVGLTDRIIACESRIPLEKITNGNLEDSDWRKYHQCLNEIEDLGIYIDDTPRVNIKKLRNLVRAKKRVNKCDMLIIDYIQLMETAKGENRANEVSDLSRELKLMSKEFDIPVIPLAQLNRSVELRGGMKKPILSDLKESGALEQDADCVIFLWRPAYYEISCEDKQGNQLEDSLHFIIAKNRQGKTGECYVKHSKDLTRLWDYDSEIENSNPVTFEDLNNKMIEPNTEFEQPPF